jgi:regulator of protease activity HflC (stomatin/prohibitin superfamily)
MSVIRKTAIILVVVAPALGCRTFHTIEPGHIGLAYLPSGGLQRALIPSGRVVLGHFCGFHACNKIYDFDVTFTTKHEEIRATSSDNLAMTLNMSVIYKPIVNELYELATEVSTDDYYNEVVGPEFRSAAGIVFAKHPYAELAANKEKIEDEIENDVRRRIKGKHVDLASITIEAIGGLEEIHNANRARLVFEQESARQRAALEQEALRQKTQLENEALRQKMALENETARKQAEIANEAAEKELQLKTELEAKRNERAIAEEDAQLERAKAAATIAKARADAEAITILARAHAEENRAATLAISPLTVEMKAYEALGQLGGSGTTILLGDYSKLPSFLLPPGLMQALYPFQNVNGGGGGAKAGAAATKK